MIPLVDLKAQYELLKKDIIPAVEEVFDSGQFILGSQVTEFEKRFANYCEGGYCVGVASGTDALHLALRALDIGEGDEVITPANTFIASALAISYSGATPVLVDIDENSFNLNLEKIKEKITEKTKAIMPVHLYGRAVEMDALLEVATSYGLEVIEDACQAHGARWKGQRVGSFGIMGCFSFYPGKNLGAYGDGGAIITSNNKIHEKLKKLRNYGSTQKYIHEILGWNSRLDSVQAAVLNVKLGYLDDWNQARVEKAEKYNELLKDVEDLILPEVPKDFSHVFHLYVIRTRQRDGLLRALNDAGIGAGIHYPQPIYSHEAFNNLGEKEINYPVTEKVSREILSLPLYPELSDEQLKKTSDTIRKYYD